MISADSPRSTIPLHTGKGGIGTEATSPELLSDPAGFFVSGYRQHGPVFRARFRGVDWIVIAGLEANDFFWQNPADWSYHEAGPGFTGQFGPTYVTQLDGPAHARKRRLLKPAFSAEAMSRLVPEMAVAGTQYLAQEASHATDADHWVAEMLLTLNSKTLLKVELTDEQKRRTSAFEEQLIWGVAVSANPDEFFSRPSYLELKSEIFGLIEAIVEDRLKGAPVADALQALITHNPPGLQPLTPEELRMDAYMLLGAGVHNTAKLITRCLERLASIPEWTESLRQELIGYRPDSFVRGVGAFPRLRATILEAERLHPGGTFLRRCPARDLEFAGYVLPAGAKVMQAHVLAHFLPEYYPEATSFRPERWLEGEPPRKTLVNFGGGAHVCLGLNLARIQTPMVLAELLCRYRWELGYVPDFRLMVDSGAEFRRPVLPMRLQGRT